MSKWTTINVIIITSALRERLVRIHRYAVL